VGAGGARLRAQRVVNVGVATPGYAPSVRLLLVACGVVILLGAGLLVASCGGGDGESATTAPSTSQTVTAITDTQTTETTTPAPAGPTEIAIVVVGGAPKGGIVRETVDKGDKVVLVVTSDVSDHIHLHGYDVMRDVAPGKPARLPFRATVPGRFEVELEDRGVPIADITVRP
jgi:hypothetical protein